MNRKKVFIAIHLLVLCSGSLIIGCDSMNNRKLEKNTINEISSKYKDNEQQIMQFINDGKDINHVFLPGKVNNSLLHVTVECTDNTSLIKLLINKGAHINAKNIYKRTPLHLAVQLEKINLVITLLAREADTTIKDQWGRTPIDYANKDILEVIRKTAARRQLP